MSDDFDMLEIAREKIQKQAARIRELEAERDEAVTQMVEAKVASEKQRALLDECKDILKEAAAEVDWPILNKIETFLAKLRAQERD